MCLVTFLPRADLGPSWYWEVSARLVFKREVFPGAVPSSQRHWHTRTCLPSGPGWGLLEGGKLICPASCFAPHPVRWAPILSSPQLAGWQHRATPAKCPVPGLVLKKLPRRQHGCPASSKSHGCLQNAK